MHIHVLKTTTPAFLNTITRISDKNLQENSIPWNEYICPHWGESICLAPSCLATGDCYRSTDGGLLQVHSLCLVSHTTLLPHTEGALVGSGQFLGHINYNIRIKHIQ